MRLKERLNKGLVHGRGVRRFAHRPLYGTIGAFGDRIGRRHGFLAWLRTHYAPWQRNMWWRTVNRLASAQVTNWPKDIRAELAQIIYEQPIYPKNLYAERIPGRHAEYKREVIDQQVRLMQQRGIWKPPACG